MCYCHPCFLHFPLEVSFLDMLARNFSGVVCSQFFCETFGLARLLACFYCLLYYPPPPPWRLELVTTCNTRDNLHETPVFNANKSLFPVDVSLNESNDV